MIRRLIQFIELFSIMFVVFGFIIMFCFAALTTSCAHDTCVRWERRPARRELAPVEAQTNYKNVCVQWERE